MSTYTKSIDLPPPYEEKGEAQTPMLEACSLVLAGETIIAGNDLATPLYQLSRSLTKISHKNTSMTFERFEHHDAEKSQDSASEEQQKKHLFYLVHPVNAQYREDTLPYYLTSASPGMIGNVSLDSSKSRLQKTEFKALLSAGRSAWDDTLFDEKGQQTLFTAKAKWPNGRYTWSDSEGRQVAVEDAKGDNGRQKLTVSAPMQQAQRDVLVAMWALRLWHDTAESGKAKKDYLESMTPASSLADGMKTSKRIGALGSLAGAA